MHEARIYNFEHPELQPSFASLNTFGIRCLFHCAKAFSYCFHTCAMKCKVSSWLLLFRPAPYTDYVWVCFGAVDQKAVFAFAFISGNGFSRPGGVGLRQPQRQRVDLVPVGAGLGRRFAGEGFSNAVFKCLFCEEAEGHHQDFILQQLYFNSSGMLGIVWCKSQNDKGKVKRRLKWSF